MLASSHNTHTSHESTQATETQHQRSVLPPELPSPIDHFIRKALNPQSLERNFEWVFDRYSEGADFIGLVAQFLTRYEHQLSKQAGEKLNGFMPVFRAGLAYRMLVALRPHRMRMADHAINPLFVETYLKKRLLAEIMGITLNDVERKIILAGRKPIAFLDDEVADLLPHTCLRHL